MADQKAAPIAVDQSGGAIYSVVGDNYRVVISGKQTNGAFAIIDMKVPPQHGPGPHAHAAFFETFYVVDGELEVVSEAGSYHAKTGSCVTIPKGGIVHGFKNVGSGIAHLLCIVVPAGLDEFFEEIGKPAGIDEFIPPPPMTPEIMKSLQAIAEKYGQELYPPDFLDQAARNKL